MIQTLEMQFNRDLTIHDVAALQIRHEMALEALDKCRLALKPHSAWDSVLAANAYLCACTVLGAEKERRAT